jgi:hypothetical protein
MKHRQKNARHQNEQSLCYRGDEQPPFLPMCVVGETKPESSKDETEEEKSAEGDCCESKLTSSGMQPCQDDGQDEGVSARFQVSVTARRESDQLNQYIPCLIRSEYPEYWASGEQCIRTRDHSPKVVIYRCIENPTNKADQEQRSRERIRRDLFPKACEAAAPR